MFDARSRMGRTAIVERSFGRVRQRRLWTEDGFWGKMALLIGCCRARVVSRRGFGRARWKPVQSAFQQLPIHSGICSFSPGPDPLFRLSSRSSAGLPTLLFGTVERGMARGARLGKRLSTGPPRALSVSGKGARTTNERRNGPSHGGQAGCCPCCCTPSATTAPLDRRQPKKRASVDRAFSHGGSPVMTKRAATRTWRRRERWRGRPSHPASSHGVLDRLEIQRSQPAARGTRRSVRRRFHASRGTH